MKKNLALALSFLSVPMLLGAQEFSAFELLQGHSSGVWLSLPGDNPLGSPNISIRGINSLHLGTTPLIVVDGVLLNTDFDSNCDPFWQYPDKDRFLPNNPLLFLPAGDVEKVEILKDAAETARFGLRGANGVILITTKKGLPEGRRITLDSNFSTDLSTMQRLNVRGREGNTQYYLSAQYGHRTGTVSGNYGNYGGIRAGADAHAGKAFDFGASLLTSVGRATNAGLPSDDSEMEYHGLANAYIHANIGSSVKVGADMGIDFLDKIRSVWYGSETFFGAAHGNAASKSSSLLNGYNAGLFLSFDRHIAGKHRLKAGVVADIKGKYGDYSTINGDHSLAEELRANSINYLNSHFQLRNFTSRYRTYGTEASLGYDYDGLAGVSMMYRAEFSPRHYGSEPVGLPAVSAYLDLHRLLIKNATGVSGLKIKGGYGQSGLEYVTPYEKLQYLVLPEIIPVQKGAESFYEGNVRLLGREWHAALQADFFGRRASFELKYYDRETSDVYSLNCFGRPVTYGGTQMWLKKAKPNTVDERESTIRSRGFELDWDWTAMKTRDFYILLYGTASYNVNIVTECEADFIYGKEENTIFARNRAPVSVFGYKELSDGTLLDVNGDGRISASDMLVLGQFCPKYLWSCGIEGGWKRISADCLVYGAGGNYSGDVVRLARAVVKVNVGKTLQFRFGTLEHRVIFAGIKAEF